MLAQVDGWDVFWNVVVFFFLFMWLILLFHILVDLFRDHEESGWSKAIWTFFLIFLPFLTVFVYLIVRGPGMATRQVKAAQAADADFRAYVQEAAGSGGAADQIARGKELLDAGAISQAEFDQIKAKALS